MPFKINLDEVQRGYCGNNVRKGEQAVLVVKGFLSSEDGDNLVTHLEGFPDEILDSLPTPKRLPPSAIDHMLVIIEKNGETTVYVNELAMLVDIRPKRSFKAGDPVYEDDIAEINRLSFDGVKIPPDAGFFFVFSHRWRKGFVFDFAPLHDSRFGERTIDVEVLLGQYLAYLQFQHLFRIDELQWETLLRQEWFPFISLKSSTLKAIVQHVQAGWEVDEMLDQISADVAESAKALLDGWKNNPLFNLHIEVFERAVERYVAKDYISATSILYSRTEGLMRTHYQNITPSLQPSDRINSSHLVEAVIGDPAQNGRYMLLPVRFNEYMRKVYFANFDPTDPAPDQISRNTVSHGIANSNSLDQKAATIGLLALAQLSFYLRS